ncbi:hypothetical protein SAMN04488072_102211 [Lentibacillus halodurans]|uniref:Uncharacterized protein n=1 Tax=Lentibacillus halodurans TaxID=237679 RepID=A0A1I0W4X4_9BACI|nr:hypothetical protein [Lentibacillus halodurans]SFA83634.1 hypothetical protein SAMN04488072_102211 [Lentibacillus halodurans]
MYEAREERSIAKVPEQAITIPSGYSDFFKSRENVEKASRYSMDSFADPVFKSNIYLVKTVIHLIRQSLLMLSQ